MSETELKDKQKIIEALNAGNIPNANVSDLCVGRDKELKYMDNILERINEDDESFTKFLQGEFGSGKSFFLKVIEEKAFQENFVVSWVTINNHVRLNKIDVIYKNIVKNLQFKTGNGLKDIIDRWYQKLEARIGLPEDGDFETQDRIIMENILIDLEDADEQYNAFTTAIISYIKSIRNENTITANKAMAWLTGDYNLTAQDKKSIGVKGDVSKETAFLFLRALSSFIKSLGYSGLVILFDEVEDTLKINNRIYRGAAFNHIREIYDGCESGDFDSMLFLFAGTNEFYDSEKGVRSYAALYDRIKPSFSEEIEDIRKPIILLKGFDDNQLKSLGKNIIKMHEEVYNWDSEGLINLSKLIDIEYEKASLRGQDVVPRDFMKRLVDYLDSVEQNPEKANKILEELTKVQEFD